MNEDDNRTWREVQLSPAHWAQIPSTANLWVNDPPDEGLDLRLQTAEEIALVIQAVMVKVLTPRQGQILELYYMESRTQVEIAKTLAISQPTVSQHLAGKQRGRSRVGGAFRRMRKAIHKAAGRRMKADSRYAQIICALDQLLARSITHRRARSVLENLARAGNRKCPAQK